MSKLELSSLYQLTMVRFRLFLREPEAVFWIFIFPILLAMGLGIAFRNRPADVLQVGATTTQLTQALATDKGLTASLINEPDGAEGLATGRILLLAIQTPGGVVYKYDDTIPMRGRHAFWPIAQFRQRQDGAKRFTSKTSWYMRRALGTSTL